MKLSPVIKLSPKTHSRLLMLNVTVWLILAIVSLSFLAGTRGTIAEYLRPIGQELGGWTGLVLGATPRSHETPLPQYELVIEPRVLEAVRLLQHAGRAEGSRDSEPYWFPGHFVADYVSYRVDLQRWNGSLVAGPLRARSWRVRFRDENTYRGFEAFTLSAADEKSDASELVMRDAARKMGLLAPLGGFAGLAINGVEVGEVFWSEGDSVAMLERAGHANGEILSTEFRSVTLPGEIAGGGDHPMSLAHYEPSILHGVAGSRTSSRKLDRLMALTRNADDAQFASEISRVLDVEKYLKWNTLAWVFANPTNNQFSGMSWLFNPVTGLLEPIARNFNQDSTARVFGTATNPRFDPLADRLLDVSEFRVRRNEILWEVVGRGGADVIRRCDQVLGEALTQLARARGLFSHLPALRDLALFRLSHRADQTERVSALGAAISASQVEVQAVRTQRVGTTVLQLDLEPTGLATIDLVELRLEMTNSTGLPPRHIALRLTDPNGERAWQADVAPEVVGSSLTLHPKGIAIAAATRRTEGRTHESPAAPWRLEIIPSFADAAIWAQPGSLSRIGLTYRNAFTGDVLPPTILLTADIGSELDAEGPNKARGFGVHEGILETAARSGLPFVEDHDVLVLPAGEYTLRDRLVIPASHRLQIEPGVILLMAPDSSLITFRAIHAEGTKDQPILIRALDPKRPFGIIGVVGAKKLSRLRYVTVSGGSKAKFDGIHFGGAISFNASPVLLTDSRVELARGADGMSVKQSHFEVVRTTFDGNGSDGLDADSSQGIIRASIFTNNGDDGLDLTNTEVRIDHSSFQWMHDKSISAGARSRVHVVSTRFADSAMAIASKDGSAVDVSGSEFLRNQLGFSLYRKKAIFGGGSGTVTGGLFSENDRDVSVEPGSHLELIGVRRETGTPPLIGRNAVALKALETDQLP